MAVYLVLSRPPDGVSAEDYNRWFDTHVQQILELPGWVAAERMELRFEKGSNLAEDPPFTYYVRYEIEGDFAPAWKALREAVAAGRMHFEDWFPEMLAGGWEGTPLGGRVVAAG